MEITLWQQDGEHQRFQAAMSPKMTIATLHDPTSLHGQVAVESREWEENCGQPLNRKYHFARRWGKAPVWTTYYLSPLLFSERGKM